jgi:hypothetical protein
MYSLNSAKYLYIIVSPNFLCNPKLPGFFRQPEVRGPTRR